MSQPWLIQSKLRPPQVHGGVPRRASLMDLEKNIFSSQLTLVVGPPGYGKTTLLAQWRKAIDPHRAVVAWLSVDDDDKDISQFAAYVLAAVTEAHRPGEGADILRQGILMDTPGAFKVAIAAILEKVPTPLALFIDDYHRAASPQNDRLLEFLLSACPDRLHMVLASRTQPGMQVSAYQAKGALREIGVAELAFDATETAQFLDKEKTGLDLAKIEARFEGWPAGLQLARLWLERAGNAIPDTRLLTGRSSDLARYMAEQVLLSLEPGLQEFLLRVSILERFNGDVANAVAVRSDGWIMLEAVARQNLFLIPIDAEGQWLRFHTLFAEFLQERLKRSRPGEDLACHRRAAEWFAAHGYFREALSHARRMEDSDYYARLVERLGGWRLMLRLGTSILQLTEDLGLDVLDKSPSLGLGYVYTLAQQGRIGEAEQWLERLRQKTDDFHVYRGKDWDSSLYADGKALEYVLRLYRDDNPSADDIRRSQALMHDLPDPNPVIDAILKNLLCYALYFEARFAESIKEGWAAAENCRRLNLAYAENYLYPFISAAYFAIGQLDRAFDACNDTVRSIVEDFGPDHPQIAVVNLYLGFHAYELGNLSEAGRLITEALPVLESRDGWVEAYITGFGTAARIAYLTEGMAPALDILHRGRRIAEARDLWRLRAEIESLEVIFLLEDGQLEAAQEKRRRGREEGYFDLRNYEKRNQTWLTLPSVASAEALGSLAAGDIKAARNNIDFLDRAAKASGNVRAQIMTLLLRFLMLTGESKRPQSIAALAAAVELGGKHGYRRTILDFGEPVRKGLQALYERKNALPEPLRHYVADLLGQSPGDDNEETGLSSREKEILVFIADGLSNKEIADRLDLAAGTIKTYRKRLYQKLDVSTRSQAIARAREFSLIH